MNIKIKRLNKTAVIPKYAKPGDGAMDLTATSYEFVNGRHVYGTGIALEIPEGYVGVIAPRSSLSNYDLRLSNHVGIIDSGFRGEITFKFENDNMAWDLSTGDMIRERKLYKIGDRIGQILIISRPQIEFTEVEDLSETERGTGGYGSTNIERSQAV